MTLKSTTSKLLCFLPKFHSRQLNPITWVFLFALVNVVLFNYPLYSFASHQLDIKSDSGRQVIFLLTSVLLLLTNTVFLFLACFSIRLVKTLVFAIFLINSVALYFMREYSVILDRSMIGNILNTRTSESGQFLNLKIILHLIIFGLIPAMFMSCLQVKKTSRWVTALATICSAVLLGGILYSCSSSWLWFDKHGKQLGGMVLPWSYIGNYVRHKSTQKQKEIVHKLLPDAASSATEKTVVVLIIGESARPQNFSLYGYQRPTNPLLASQQNLVVLEPAEACATYTVGAIECILSNTAPGVFSGAEYEPLPSYLHRNGINVVWRSNNWGETKLDIDEYIEASDLRKSCTGSECAFDGILLQGLKEQIQNHGDLQFIVLHQTGSHGPSYASKYPAKFEQFTPVCNSVDLKACGLEKLVNAYDNTVLYTDYFINETIELLKTLEDRDAVVIYMSDHGESLGESGLFLHGTPMNLAPREQVRIPFLVWMNDSFIQHNKISLSSFGNRDKYTQDMVFHSVMGALKLNSSIYDAELDLFAGHGEPAVSEE